MFSAENSRAELREAKRLAERKHLTDLLERAGGNVSEAARLAGMDRSNFRRALVKSGARAPALDRGRSQVMRKLLLIAEGQPDADVSLARSVNVTEATFLNHALKKGWKALRRGWPDFVCAADGGKVVGIEVKLHRLERLQASQVETFEVLERAGLRIYVWSKDEPDKLRPWRAHQSAALRAKQERRKRARGT